MIGFYILNLILQLCYNYYFCKVIFVKFFWIFYTDNYVISKQSFIFPSQTVYMLFFLSYCTLFFFMLFWDLNLFYSKFFNIFNSWKKMTLYFLWVILLWFPIWDFHFLKHWIFVNFYGPSHFAFSKMLLYDHKFCDHILLLFVFYLYYYILLFLS